MLEPKFFGAGALSLIPSGDTPSPHDVGVLEDVSVEMTSETKELFGNRQFPVATATGKSKITGKFKSGMISARLANLVFPGAVITRGRSVAAEETFVISGATAEVTNSADFEENLSVNDLTAGDPLIRVDSGPAEGEYAVTDGVYTFDGSANGHSITIRYRYSVATGSKLVYSNQLMGKQQKFRLVLTEFHEDNDMILIVPSVTLGKITLPFKNDDFAMQDGDFHGSEANDRTVWEWHTKETLPVTA